MKMAESIEPSSNSAPVNRGCAEGTEQTKMAESEGVGPNTLDEVLRELADWNIILSEHEEELREIYGSDE